MIAIASIRRSQSGDYVFVNKIDADAFHRKSIHPWQLAQEFYERMSAIPDNILIYENEEEVARYYAGIEYPAAGDWRDG